MPNDWYLIPIALILGALAIWFVIRAKRKAAEKKAPAKNSPILTKDGERLDLSDYFKGGSATTPNGETVWLPRRLPPEQQAWLFNMIDEGLESRYSLMRGETDEDGQPYDDSQLVAGTFNHETEKVLVFIDEVYHAPSGAAGLKVLSGLTGTTEVLTFGTVLGGGSQWSVFGNYHPFRLVCLPLLDPVIHADQETHFKEGVGNEACDHSKCADLDPKYHTIKLQSEIHPFFPKK